MERGMSEGVGRAAARPDDPPTLREELDRKTNEAVIHFLTKYQQGGIDAETLGQSLEAMWYCVAGLVPLETSELLDTALSGVEPDPMRRQAMLFSSERQQFVQITRNSMSEPRFTVRTRLKEGVWKHEVVHDFSSEAVPALACKRKMTELIEKLEGLGFCLL